ncbi:hypothetical protein [Aurantiacibacter sp. MUD61]|uniref:hypothetical protein n=1 Tax=Aurantiacibacter sp. MUD61 TaxID=3009083 RepID=UPI0022F13564|nr:hypothetical protein [Aurantiacibacter sp. MUD61]
MSVLRDPIGWWDGLDRPLRHLPRAAAAALLLLLAFAMAWAAWSAYPVAAPENDAAEAQADLDEGDGDIALYQRISERVIAGENYYAAALAEQRANGYPTVPFVTVRQPTLAMLHRWIGVEMLGYILFAALPAIILLLVSKLKDRTRLPEWVCAALFTVLGGVGLMIPQSAMIHEIAAGACLGLALVTYTPERWWIALVFAALALALRELSLPFVLLWLAFALAGRRWKEAAGVTAVLALFAIGMFAHYLGVEAARLPGDPVSPGWDAMAGPMLSLGALSKLAAIPFVPKWLEIALMILPLVGWLALGGRLGLFATLWFAGFLTAVALFARPENFYWVQLTLPVYLAGLAFAPRALADLFAATRTQKPTLS